MQCISIVDARYIKDHQIALKFNTGETGEVDLRDLVFKYPVAEPLRNPEISSRFSLDSWPTLEWDCGFDIAPESLYQRATGKSQWETKAT
jgi:hypothetical protein